MLKLILCLCFCFALAVMTLELRQQRLELDHDASVLHNAIESQQAKLWSQQLQIGAFTAPNAIQQTVRNQNIQLVPREKLLSGTGNWADGPDASRAEAE